MMPEQLWATTLDPARRTLRRLTVEVRTLCGGARLLLWTALVGGLTLASAAAKMHLCSTLHSR